MVRIAFTGHRPDKLGFGYNVNDKRYDPLKQAVVDVLESIYLIDGDITEAYTGGALGFDWIAYDILGVMRSHGWRGLSILAVPFAQQDANWTEYDADTYRRMKLRADKIVYVDEVEGYQPKNNAIGVYSGAKMYLRNMYMVDNADVVIACWDGIEKGGTWNCVDYALKKGKIVVVINPKTYEKTTMWRSLPGQDASKVVMAGKYVSYKLTVQGEDTNE